jgi:transporter family protein
MVETSPKFIFSEKTPLVQTTGESPRELKSHHSGSSAYSDTIKSPPLAVWIAPALLCALAYAFYNIFIKKGSASIHPVLGGVILQLVAAVLGMLLLAFIVARDGGVEELDWDWAGVQWSICAGISVGLAEMISFFVSSLGVQAMQSIPILIGGSVMFGTFLGLCLLGEVLSYHGWLGVALLITGICLVATDPAATSALGH